MYALCVLYSALTRAADRTLSATVAPLHQPGAQQLLQLSADWQSGQSNDATRLFLQSMNGECSSQSLSG